MECTMITSNIGPFKPSTLTAYERYEALIPILSEASETYLRLYSEKKSAPRDEEIAGRLNSLFQKVAANGSMGVEEARRAFHGFTTKGMAGLMTPTPLKAEDCVQDARGTWELKSRITNGGLTPNARVDNHSTRARSKIYYEVTSPTQIKELVTMWNDENHYDRDEALSKNSQGPDETFCIVAFGKSDLRQVDDYTVEYTYNGEVIGNHSHYRSGANVMGRVLIMRLDGEPSYVSIPESYGVTKTGKLVPATGTFLLLNGTRNGRSIGFKMSGLPPMNGDTRTMDVSDYYEKVSEQQPLVGGWEPIESYYARLRNVQGYADDMKRVAGERYPVHGFYSEDRETLKRFDIV
jgi:hypothetical protein